MLFRLNDWPFILCRPLSRSACAYSILLLLHIVHIGIYAYKYVVGGSPQHGIKCMWAGHSILSLSHSFHTIFHFSKCCSICYCRSVILLCYYTLSLWWVILLGDPFPPLLVSHSLSHYLPCDAHLCTLLLSTTNKLTAHLSFSLFLLRAYFEILRSLNAPLRSTRYYPESWESSGPLGQMRTMPIQCIQRTWPDQHRHHRQGSFTKCVQQHCYCYLFMCLKGASA